MWNTKDLTGQRFGKLIALHPTEERRSTNVMWECQCDCGNKTVVAATSLTQNHTKSCGCLRKKNLAGKRFGKLTAIRPMEERKGKQVVWECKCDCGNTAYVMTYMLTRGDTKSCGCIKEEISSDLTGQKFGRLTVLRVTDERRHENIVWECRCDCGTITRVTRHNLVSGNIQSCGCLQKERAGESASLRLAKDITGQKFGRLTAICPTKKRNIRGIVWKCLCDCGTEYYVDVASLVSGHTRSCGCLMSEVNAQIHTKDLTGQRFGKLIALHPTEERKGSFVLWKCQCDCGNTTLAKSGDLLSGKAKSCGCRRVEKAYEMQENLDRVDGTVINALKNDKPRSNNTTGYNGVTKTKRGQYHAYIGFQRKTYHLGFYTDLEDAIAVRKKAEALLHHDTIDYYARYKEMAEKDPQWAKENPVKIMVTRKEANEFEVSFEPYI